jgi:hypothetical protein
MTLKYPNPRLQIALADWRTVYILFPEQEQLLAEGCIKGN